MSRPEPSIDQWLAEAKGSSAAPEVGMWLTHNGVVRRTPKQKVRAGIDDGTVVEQLTFHYDEAKVASAITRAEAMEGIAYVRVWLNDGTLEVGDSIMYVLIGGDIRPHTVDCLQALVGEIKSECVEEVEHRTA
jgi:molybdopterin synthase catalytic subunit